MMRSIQILFLLFGGRLLPFNSGGTHAESDVFKHHDVLWYWP